MAEVDPAKGSAVLQGIDQPRQVEVGAAYLAQTNPHSEAPALQHAYAVTTYAAQGSTFDRAFVAADPSMDKRELYVAASRTREQTYLYATPEVQTHREEIAPESPYLREGIPHIAEAAERDRAQLAAHEVALRSRFSGLPSEELVARRNDLRAAADREARVEERRSRLQKRIDQARENIARYEVEREAAQALPRRQRREELTRLDSYEAHSLTALSGLEAQARELPPAGEAARRELAIAEQVLAERRELAITATRISPPAYVKAELGERPSDPAKQKAWIAASRRSSATVKSTASKTRAERSAGRRSGEPSERARRRRGGGCRRRSEPWTLGGMPLGSAFMASG